MDVLLIGSGQLTEAMIHRLNKNGDRVYLLTDRRVSRPIGQRVFEEYHFPYDSDSIGDIFESVKPDVTVFTGAWDSYFNWQKARQESVRYTSSLANLLTVYAMTGKGRFIYLSSQEVFSGSFLHNVPESEEPSPKGLRSMAIAQGEEICANYRRNQGLDICTLRLDHLYSVPEKGKPEDDPCGVMCLEALRSGKIFASDREVFSLLFVRDAAELVCKVVSAPQCEQAVYHISSMEELNSLQLAKLVQENLDDGVELLDESVGEVRRVVLDGSAFAAEFDQKIFVHAADGVKQVASYMKRYRESFIRAEDAGGSLMERMAHRLRALFAALLPYVENIVCFVLVFLLDRYTAGNGFFDRLDFFLLYVLLFAVTMGQRQAVLSGVLALAGYCLRVLWIDDAGISALLLDSGTYVWTAQLFIVGMSVGYLKDRLGMLRKESDDEIEYLEGRLKDLAEINDSNVRIKENYEAQLVNQRDSLGKIHEITSVLERQAPEEVLFTAARVLMQLMDCSGASVYRVANHNYARLFAFTSEEARSLGNSIEYTAMPELYDELKERRVFINKTMKEGLPLMASAVYSGDEMQLIFMLWGIPWQRMTIAEANRLAVIGQMVQAAVVQATRYIDALSGERYVGDTHLMEKEAFQTLAGAFLQARDQGLTECVLLKIAAPLSSWNATLPALEASIRRTDYMGVGEDDTLYVLLSNTGSEAANVVVSRLQAAGCNASIAAKEVTP